MRNYSKTDIIEIIQDLLERPGLLIDAIQNENTETTAEDLFNVSESGRGETITDVKLAADAWVEKYGVFAPCEDAYIAGYNHALSEISQLRESNLELVEALEVADRYFVEKVLDQSAIISTEPEFNQHNLIQKALSKHNNK